MGGKDSELIEVFRARSAENGESQGPSKTVPEGSISVSRRALVVAVGIAVALCVLSGLIGYILRGSS